MSQFLHEKQFCLLYSALEYHLDLLKAGGKLVHVAIADAHYVSLMMLC